MLGDIVTRLVIRVAELERRLDGMAQRGTVQDVDAAAGTVRLRLGGTDDQPFLSPAVPYAQIAGALKAHTPPSAGQQMVLLSGAGDFRQGIALPMTWSNDNPSPSAAGDEHVITFGAFRATLKDDSLELAMGNIRLVLSTAEIVTYGKTRLDDGERRVAFLGAATSDGAAVADGANEVYV